MNKRRSIVHSRSYILSGLVQHYDAINNTRSGHNALSSVWEDLVGNNDGTIENAVWEDKSLRFNGNARVRYRGDITPMYTMMMTASVDHNISGLHPRLTDGNQYPGLYAYNGASDHPFTYRIYGHGKDTLFTPTKAAPNGKLVHLTYLFDGTQVKLYFNGVYQGNVVTTINATSVATTYLGANNTETRYLTGNICNFMRFDRVFTDKEIRNNALVDKYRFKIPA